MKVRFLFFAILELECNLNKNEIKKRIAHQKIIFFSESDYPKNFVPKFL